MEIRIENINELSQAASRFLEAIGDRRHIAFHADMGVGKTTFISALCKALGMEDEASSPTFSIVNEYRAADAESGTKQSFGREQLREGGNKDFGPEQLREGEEERVYHFDFYRIESVEETLDLGLDDYFDSGCFCFMEWPENVDGFLPDDTLDVTIEEDETGVRIIRFEN